MVGRNILLNPGPATTTDTVKMAQVVPDICPREKDFQKVMSWIRRSLVKIADGDENYTSILFSGSGTAVMEATLTSVVPPNKKVLIISNGLYGERFEKIAQIHNIPFVTLSFKWGEKIDLNMVRENLENNNDTACVVVVHHETTTGVLNPIREIGRVAKNHDCVFVVDTISSFAGIDFSVKDCNIDFMMSTSNKCIQGMAGVAFVICKKSELEKAKHYPPRSLYLNLYSQYEFFERTEQTQFTPPVQVMYALKQAIHEFLKEGAENRYERYKKNYNALVNGLKERGFELFLNDDVEHSNLLVTVVEPNHPHFDFNTLHDKMYAKGFTIYPGLLTQNTFRIAVIGDLYQSDIKRFLKTLDETLAEMKVNL